MKIGVIMGGISSEKEVSLSSGKSVLKYLDKSKYEDIIPIVINSKKEAIEKIKGINFAFLALHGKFGEDGTIQGLLETLGIPYSGCKVTASVICMNKDITKRILKSAEINTAPWITVRSADEIDYKKIEELNYPVFVKPNSGGSSIATFCVNHDYDLKRAVNESLKYDNEIIIEKFIDGKEISSFMLNGEVFPTIQINPKKSGFFNYESKYDDGGAEENAAVFQKDLQSKINEVSKKVWDVIGCKCYCRIDMIIKDGIPFVLEINTLPGLTPSSIIPKSAKKKGIEFSELLDKIIEYSLD